MNTVNREWAEREAQESRDAGQKRPILYPQDVEGEPDLLRVTVMSAESYRRGTKVAVEFREFPGKILWAVGRGLLNAADELGDVVTGWPGRKVTLEKVRRFYRGREWVKYDFAPSAAKEENAPKIRRLRRREHGNS